MAQGRGTVINMARGPWEVTAENARSIAWQIDFRHYKPDELQLARDFIASGRLPGTWWTDVYLETPASKQILSSRMPTTAGEVVPWMNRIDAIVESGAVTHIVEFKLRLRPSGIGELATYKLQYALEYKPTTPIELDYVCKYDSAEHHPALEAQGIRLWIV